MMPDCLPALGIRETPLTGSFIEECIGRVDLGGAVEGGRYGSVHGHGPSEWASTFDRLIGIDRTTERLSATAGWRGDGDGWRYCGGDGCR